MRDAIIRLQWELTLIWCPAVKKWSGLWIDDKSSYNMRNPECSSETKMSQRCIFPRRLKEVLLIRCQGKLHLTFQLSRWVKVWDGRLECITVKHAAEDWGVRKEKRCITREYLQVIATLFYMAGQAVWFQIRLDVTSRLKSFFLRFRCVVCCDWLISLYCGQLQKD